MPTWKDARWISCSVEAIRAFGAMLAAQHIPHDVHLYEGAQHGFLAYTRPPRYDPAVRALSWQRTVAFLRRALG